MNRVFSKGVRLLIQNWDLLDEIQRAKEDLGRTVSEALLSLQGSLKKEDWWSSEWTFENYSEAQVWLWHSSWAVDSATLLWLGVENFTPNSIFGGTGSPQAYLYISGSENRDLLRPLTEFVEGLEGKPGEADQKGTNLYVVRKATPKCLFEELDRFDEITLDPILRFFRFYGERGEEIGEIIQDHRTNTD